MGLILYGSSVITSIYIPSTDEVAPNWVNMALHRYNFIIIYDVILYFKTITLNQIAIVKTVLRDIFFFLNHLLNRLEAILLSMFPISIIRSVITSHQVMYSLAF